MLDQSLDARAAARLFITGYAENTVLSHGHFDPGMYVLTEPFDMSVRAPGPLARPGEDPVAAVIAAVRALDGSYLAV